MANTRVLFWIAVVVVILATVNWTSASSFRPSFRYTINIQRIGIIYAIIIKFMNTIIIIVKNIHLYVIFDDVIVYPGTIARNTR